MIVTENPRKSTNKILDIGEFTRVSGYSQYAAIYFLKNIKYVGIS